MPIKPKKKKEDQEILDKPPVRQIVEVVEQESIPEAIEVIKKDTQEIEDAVAEIEEHIEADHQQAPELHEEIKEVDHRSAVESLFAREQVSAIAPEITVEKPKNRSFAVWAGLMIGIVLAVGVGLLLFVKGPGTFSVVLPNATPTTTPTSMPTPTTNVVNKSDIKIRVVNGGGVSGAATKMKEFLEELGYSVVSVGNSDDYSYTQTEIGVKFGKESIVTMLVSDLASEYEVASTSSVLEDDVEYDALVTVGK